MPTNFYFELKALIKRMHRYFETERKSLEWSNNLSELLSFGEELIKMLKVIPFDFKRYWFKRKYTLATIYRLLGELAIHGNDLQTAYYAFTLSFQYVFVEPEDTWSQILIVESGCKLCSLGFELKRYDEVSEILESIKNYTNAPAKDFPKDYELHYFELYLKIIGRELDIKFVEKDKAIAKIKLYYEQVKVRSKSMVDPNKINLDTSLESLTFKLDHNYQSERMEFVNYACYLSFQCSMENRFQQSLHLINCAITVCFKAKNIYEKSNLGQITEINYAEGKIAMVLAYHFFSLLSFNINCRLLEDLFSKDILLFKKSCLEFKSLFKPFVELPFAGPIVSEKFLEKPTIDRGDWMRIFAEGKTSLERACTLLTPDELMELGYQKLSNAYTHLHILVIKEIEENEDQDAK